MREVFCSLMMVLLNALCISSICLRYLNNTNAKIAKIANYKEPFHGVSVLNSLYNGSLCPVVYLWLSSSRYLLDRLMFISRALILLFSLMNTLSFWLEPCTAPPLNNTPFPFTAPPL